MQEEFLIRDNVLVKYQEQEGKTKVVIPDGVTEIGPYAFMCCEKIENVVIPEGVTKIGNWAFAICTSLKDITLPDSILKIEKFAFVNCKKLENITIPDRVMEIGENAFLGTKIIDIILPNSIKKIKFGAFDSKYIKRISVPSYNVFSKIFHIDLKIIVLNTIIKNKQQFSEEEINKLNKYIIENKITILNFVFKNNNLLDLLNYMLNNMGPIYTMEEVDSILKEVTTLDEISNKAEITGMLLEYKKKNFEFGNSLDEFDLGEFNEEEIHLSNVKYEKVKSM